MALAKWLRFMLTFMTLQPLPNWGITWVNFPSVQLRNKRERTGSYAKAQQLADQPDRIRQSALFHRTHVVVEIARDQPIQGIETCSSRHLIDDDNDVGFVLIDLLFLQLEELFVGVHHANVNPVVDRRCLLKP
jgi:hypothetical protein